ncbi:helix-turn-helix domain-containing protein [Rhodocyclus gracilis]|uniref:XRE family transcriptional regulator n=1 Tax=Rhodocyclus tenuis TaxID=1066 RepID=A0A6L5JVC8_RHOTE|nr:XRE family transcriptional regulator [Rhodocyclus gracilis]MQY50772.1 XRE family transcriptional regulator [Rhodocyclus gracilis]
MKSINAKTVSGGDALAIRKEKQLNQAQFWGPIGVSQSGGSRYESGRKLPKPIQLLLAIAHGSEAVSRKAVAEIRGEKAA